MIVVLVRDEDPTESLVAWQQVRMLMDVVAVDQERAAVRRDYAGGGAPDFQVVHLAHRPSFPVCDPCFFSSALLPSMWKRCCAAPRPAASRRHELSGRSASITKVIDLKESIRSSVGFGVARGALRADRGC